MKDKIFRNNNSVFSEEADIRKKIADKIANGEDIAETFINRGKSYDELRQDNRNIIKYALSNNVSINNKYDVIINATDGNTYKYKTYEVISRLIEFLKCEVDYYLPEIDNALETLDKDSMRKAYNKCGTIIFMCEKIKALYGGCYQLGDLCVKLCNEYEDMVKTSVLINNGEVDLALLVSIIDYELIAKKSYVDLLAQQLFHINQGVTDEDIINVCNNFLGKETSRKLFKYSGEDLLIRKKAFRYLIKNDIISKDDIVNRIQSKKMVEYFKNGNDYLLEYIKPEEIFKLYLEGNINVKALERYTDLKSLFLSNIETSQKMEILKSEKGRRIYNKSDSSFIWELFEKNLLEADDVFELQKMKYIKTDSIIKKYYEEKERAIARELGVEKNISDEKIADYFTPEHIFNEIKNNYNDTNKMFYSTEIKTIYENYNRNFEEELSNYINTICENDESKKEVEHMDLYKKGIVSSSTLKKSNISENSCLKYYQVNDCDNKVLIDFYNNNLISQDTVYELLNDEFDDKVLELINEGLDISVIQGLYSTSELISKAKNGKISLEQLSKIKSDVKAKSSKNETDLTDLYLSEDLTYAELYNLAEYGVISKEEADEINDKFNLREDLDKLRGKGIKGKPLDFLYKDQPEKIIDDKNIHDSTTRKKYSKGNSVSSNLKVELFKKLGGKEIIEVKDCPLFDGYVMIPIEEKKVGILEGNGRTYIMPLKIFIEQVKNPGSELDLIGNATSRNSLNRKKDYVSSVNHTKNWGANVIKKMCKISSNKKSKTANELIESNRDILNQLSKSYDDRKVQYVDISVY